MKRIISLLIIVTMLAIMLSGCGSAKKEKEKSKRPPGKLVWEKLDEKGKVNWNSDYKCCMCNYSGGRFYNDYEDDEGECSGTYKMTFNGDQCHTEVTVKLDSINDDGAVEVEPIKDPPDDFYCFFEKDGELKYLHAGYDSGKFTLEGKEIFNELKAGKDVEVTFKPERYQIEYDEYYEVNLKAGNFPELVNSYK